MNWLTRLFHKSHAESDLDRELRSHLEQQIATHIANGLTPAEARRQANLEFGGLERVKEEVRATRWETHLENFARDFRYAIRGLRKDKKFSFVAIFTLALGIGSATAIFSIVHSVLLNPFPYSNVDRLAAFNIHFIGDSDGNERYYFSPAEFLDFKNQNHVFDEMIGLSANTILYTGKAETRRFAGALVTANTFEILGVKPLLGRPVTSEDGNPNSARVFAMSFELWSSEFNRDPNIVGTTLILNDEPRTLTAIMPPRFRFGEFFRYLDSCEFGKVPGCHLVP
jgi:hypothetical protein